MIINPNFPYVKKLIEQYELYATDVLGDKPSAIAYAAKKEIAAAEEFLKKAVHSTTRQGQNVQSST